MATVFTRIQRKILQGEFEITIHCLDELADENFSLGDAISAILNATDFDKLTGDESHIRYVFHGCAKDGRTMKVTVFLSQGTVFIKTVYECFYE